MNNSRAAILSGWGLLAMAVIAGYALGYAFTVFYSPHTSDTTAALITANKALYSSMLVGIVSVLILDVLVSYTLYSYFKDTQKRISWIAGSIRLLYTLIFGYATLYLFRNVNAEYLHNEFLYANFKNFEVIWNLGLVLFGMHLLLIGFLMKLHNRIPNLLAYVTAIAGISYGVIHTLKVLQCDPEFLTILEMIFMLPMILGELGLAIWLLWKGKGQKETA